MKKMGIGFSPREASGRRPATAVKSILKKTTNGTPASAAKARKRGQAKTPEREGLFPKTPPGRSGKKRFQ